MGGFKYSILALIWISALVQAQVQEEELQDPLGGQSFGMARKIESTSALGWHLLRSHSRDILVRPVGSLRDLLFYTTTAVTGLVKDTTLDLVLVPGLEEEVAPLGESPGMDLQRWEVELDRLSGRSLTSGSIELLVDGEAFFDRLEAEIQNARSSIRIRTYIFDNDDVALNIADRLKDRSWDIDIEVMFDGVGTWGGGQVNSPSQPDTHQAPVSIAAYLAEESAINVGVLGNAWLMGDHTKTFLFDDRVAFIGGMNIGREYRYDWHDLMIELHGPVVTMLSMDSRRASMKRRWGDFSFLQSDRKQLNETSVDAGPDDVSLRLLYTDPHDAEIYRAQLAAIKRSRNYVFIENAYLGDDQLLYELIRARQRGVDVRVIVPNRPDSELMNRSNAVALNLLSEHGVRVFLYPGMSHVKAAIYDGWVCLGTANFDKLSFKVNKEVNVATSDPGVAQAVLEQVFERDFSVSVELPEPLPVNLADHVYERIVDVIL